MTDRSLKLVLVSTPIGWVGSGAGGGVELTLSSLVQGLGQRGHQITMIAPRGSSLPEVTGSIQLVEVSGSISRVGNTPCECSCSHSSDGCVAGHARGGSAPSC